MKNKLGLTVLFAAIVGFTGGLLGEHLISPAYAASNNVVKVDSYEDMMRECNFDKTIIEGSSGIFCVKK